MLQIVALLTIIIMTILMLLDLSIVPLENIYSTNVNYDHQNIFILHATGFSISVPSDT